MAIFAIRNFTTGWVASLSVVSSCIRFSTSSHLTLELKGQFFNWEKFEFSFFNGSFVRWKLRNDSILILIFHIFTSYILSFLKRKKGYYLLESDQRHPFVRVGHDVQQLLHLEQDQTSVRETHCVRFIKKYLHLLHLQQILTGEKTWLRVRSLFPDPEPESRPILGNHGSGPAKVTGSGSLN